MNPLLIAVIVVAALAVAGGGLVALLAIAAQIGSTRASGGQDAAHAALRDVEWAHMTPRQQIQAALQETVRHIGDVDE